MGLAGVILTFRDRLDGWILAGEEGMTRFGRAAEMVLGLVPIGAAIDDLDAVLPPDDLELGRAAGFAGVLRPGVITTRRRERLLLVGRLADVLPIGVMIVERRVPITVARVLDLLIVGRLTDEFLVTLLVLEVLFLTGVMVVLRCEVNERADEPVLLRLATSTERLTGREKVGLVVVERVLLEGVEGLVTDERLVVVDLGAGLRAGADLVLLGGEVRREDETLGADLLGLREGALAAGRDARGDADRLFGAGFEAELLAGDRLAELLEEERDDEDGLPRGGLGLPNAGPRVMIAVRSTANSVFSTCLVNIFLSPFPGRCSGSFKEPTASDPSGQIELFSFP